MKIPQNLQTLCSKEEELRAEALQLVDSDVKLLLHMEAVEQAMGVANALRQQDIDDEDLKAIQVLGIRVFNAFSSSLKLALSGYFQNSALIMRDVLETVFLLDYFRSHREMISEWRHADRATRLKKFKPVSIREALDERDGFTTKKRAEMYEMFSELAGHPNMKAYVMMQPQRGGYIYTGPFMDITILRETLGEMGRLGVQAGEILNSFFPENISYSFETRETFLKTREQWMATFYPTSFKKD